MRETLVPLLLCTIVACNLESDDRDVERPWQTTTRRAGDTTIVRTTGVRDASAMLSLVPESSIGGAEGDTLYTFALITELAIGPANSVFVADRRPLSIRQYDSSGRFVRSIGRRGQGPGEYSGINGMGVHRDGRVAAWDAGNRVLFFGPDGQPSGSTQVPGGGRYSTIGAMLLDTLGHTYIRTRIADPPPQDDMQRTGRMFGITGLVRFRPDGTVGDSLRPPDVVLDIPQLVASANGGTAMYSVPFSPGFHWTFSPLGYFVSARGDAYAIDLTTPQGQVTRIEMEAERVSVRPGEKAEAEESATDALRRTDPNWKWNGAPIPEAKPFIRGLSVSDDGRIWVSIPSPGEEIPIPAGGDPPAGGRPRRTTTWREPTVYDVFEPDGRYLGRVPMPPRSTWRAARGNSVWAVTLDSLDVQQVTRYRVTPGF